MNRNRGETSAVELIALLTGRMSASGLAEAHRLIDKIGLHKLPVAGTAEIQSVCRGLSSSAIARLKAEIEVGLRIAELKSEYATADCITGPATAIRFCLSRFGRIARECQQEQFWIVSLNTKNRPIDCHQITVGTLRSSLVHPREVSRAAIRDAASCILVVHNHPSGDPPPSDQDLSVAERLESTAEIIGIPVIDHIVVGHDRAVSLQEWRSGNRHAD